MDEGCYIFGAGAHGRVVADILFSQRKLVTGFLDDTPALHQTCIASLPVLGGSDLLLGLNVCQRVKVIVALGTAPVRLDLSERFQRRGHLLINAIHRCAVVSPAAFLGSGICLCAGAVVNPDACIGDAVIINTGATVDHDCQVDEGAHLSPGVHLAGRVKVGRLSFLGTGVSVAPRVRIGPNTVVGAGSVVLGDLPGGVLAVGAPARIVRELVEPVEWRRLL
jgi:sugar O-acyltransferase (sialic acid O-acetyltransferase NeuD family)